MYSNQIAQVSCAIYDLKTHPRETWAHCGFNASFTKEDHSAFQQALELAARAAREDRASGPAQHVDRPLLDELFHLRAIGRHVRRGGMRGQRGG